MVAQVCHCLVGRDGCKFGMKARFEITVVHGVSCRGIQAAPTGWVVATGG